MELFLHFTNNVNVMTQTLSLAILMQLNSKIHQANFWFERKHGGPFLFSDGYLWGHYTVFCLLQIAIVYTTDRFL